MTEEITNLRSLGGYSGTNGRVKEGFFFRSGQLFELSDSQLHYLSDELKIKKIFDFRGTDERKRFPDDLWSGAEYVVLDVLKDAVTNQASVEEIVSGDGQVDENMLKTYEEMALCDSSRQSYHHFLLSLIEEPEPVIFHCYAGKDRTGVGAALILKSLGVSDDQIFDDYLKTNVMRKSANQEILTELEDKLTPEQLKGVETALCVKPDYLKRYFSTIDKHYDSFDHYLEEVLICQKISRKRWNQCI